MWAPPTAWKVPGGRAGHLLVMNVTYIYVSAGSNHRVTFNGYVNRSSSVFLFFFSLFLVVPEGNIIIIIVVTTISITNNMF